MISWVLTIVFASTSLFHTGRLMRSGRPGLRHTVHDGSHALMGAAMIAMLWWPRRPVLTSVSIAAFGGATLWFLYVGTHPQPRGRHTHHLRSAAPWYHSAMMGSMVWMAVAMALMPSMGAGMEATISAMDHGGGYPHAMAAAAPVWIRAGCEIGAIGFFMAALWMVAAGLWWTATGDEMRPSAPSVASSCLMAAGMSVAFAQMAS